MPPENPDEQAAVAATIDRMKAAEKKGRGGYRPGAGRIAERGPTRVMRIPDAYREAVVALMEHLDATAPINYRYAPVESEPLFLRSLHGKAQRLIFKTIPVDFSRAAPPQPVMRTADSEPDSSNFAIDRCDNST
ncbi:hypothetical protein [Geopseudomonas aromaticivorans]